MRGLVQKPMLGDECMSDGTSPADRNNVGKWQFNEGSGLIAQDLSGHNNTGTLQANTHFVAGKFGSALEFDGVGDYVDFGSPSILRPTSQVTLAIWLKIDGFTPGGWDYVYSSNGSYSKSGYGLWLEGNTGLPEYFLYTTSNKRLKDDEALTVGQRYFMVITYDGSYMRMYRDAVEVTSFAKTGAIDYSQEVGNNKLGDASDYMDFEGVVSHLYIFSRALNSSEIALLYREPFVDLGPRTMNLYVPAAAGNPWNYYAQAA